MNCTSGYHFQITEYQIKRKKNSERVREKDTLLTESQRWKLHWTFPQKPCKQEVSGIQYLKGRGQSKTKETSA